jgi:uncharacterized protein (DUF58 family)
MMSATRVKRSDATPPPSATPNLDRYLPFLRYWWLFRLTPLGRALLVAWFLSGTLGSTSIDVPLFRLFFFLCCLLIVALVAGWMLRPRLKATINVPANVVAGERALIEVLLHNPRRRRAYDVGVSHFEGLVPVEEEPGLVNVAAAETTRYQVALRPVRRGLYAPLNLRAFSARPFNLFRTPAVRTVGRVNPLVPKALETSLLVLPRFQPLAQVILPVAARHHPGGIALLSNVGESPEYIGNREYRPGDPLRRIDFKAWARLGKPAVREYQEEYLARIALVLDTYVPPGRRAPKEGYPDFEAAVSLTAAIADVLARGEYLIDLFAAGPELHVFRAGRHMAHFDNVLEILASVDACRTNPFDNLAPALVDELGSVSAVVGVFLDWTPEREQLMRVAQDHGCAVKALVVRDGAPTIPLDTADFAVVQLTPAQVQAGVEVV